MAKLNSSASNMLLSLTAVIPIFFLLTLFLVALAWSGLTDSSFIMSDEIRISSKDINCDYFSEDYTRRWYNFKYPKLIIAEDQPPVAVLIDENTKKLVFVEIADQGPSITNIAQGYDEKNLFTNWPIIFMKENKIYLAFLINTQSDKKRQYGVRLFLLDKGNNKLHLVRETRLANIEVINDFSKSDSFLSGIYPYDDGKGRFMLVGTYTKSYFHPLTLIAGDQISYNKNFSLIWEDDKIGDYQTIEEKGWFGAEKRAYAISDSGIANSSWVRSTSRVSISAKHNETVCYSQNKDGTRWTKPLELYSVKKTNVISHVRDLSLSTYGTSAFLLWQDIENGFYFAEVKDGALHEQTRISDLKPLPPEKTEYIEPLFGAPGLKITVDHKGNVYALWVLNDQWKYKIFVKGRIKGKWTEANVVSSGPGVAKLPDMKVDKQGVIHITYLKETPKEKFACYYLKLEPARR